MVIPRSASEAGAVVVDGMDAIPSTPLAWSAVFALESIEAALPLPPPVPTVEPVALCAVHVVPSSVVGDGPADALARRHDDPDGVPAAPLPPDPFAEKSSAAEDG